MSMSVDESAAWAARMAAKRAHASWRPSRAALRYRIKLRRFAGPAAYSDRIGHLRIAHLTDQHVGRVTPMAVQLTAVELANAERPDLVLLTGDFVCHSQLYLDQLTEVMRMFRAPVIRNSPRRELRQPMSGYLIPRIWARPSARMRALSWSSCRSGGIFSRATRPARTSASRARSSTTSRSRAARAATATRASSRAAATTRRASRTSDAAPVHAPPARSYAMRPGRFALTM